MAARADQDAWVRERLAQVLASTSAVPPAGVPPAGPPGGFAEPAPPLAAGARRRFAGAAFDPGRRGVRALAVLAVLVLAGAAAFAWQARPRADPLGPVAGSSDVSAEPSGSATGGLVVDVAGRVRRPGLVHLPPGARVADAIEAAGGVLPGTDLSSVNLARKLSDGELILVGVVGPGASAGAAQAGGKLNLNTATLAQLDALPGIGTVLAQRILDYREQHGGFRSVAELQHVDGIGDARFDDLKNRVTV
ncbi:MAG TPA: ComEA family DNA-binding protein [Micromonosporaceae bacterium]|jgi:competence protein ComEA|nr:ComEA family DNA-binding protein [Micromonosporaceae bacterium]